MVSNYLALSDVKAYMLNNEDVKSGFWDTWITSACSIVSRQVDKSTFGEPGCFAVTTPTTRDFDGIPLTATSFEKSLFIGELAAAPTSVAISQNGDPNNFVVIPSINYFPAPYNALLQGRPYLRLNLNTATGTTKRWPCAAKSIRITGLFGYSQVVPQDLFEGCMLILVKYLMKAIQQYIETGIMLDTAQLNSMTKLDSDIKDLSNAYKRDWRINVSNEG